MTTAPQRAWYFTHIFADPKSADTVYMLTPAISLDRWWQTLIASGAAWRSSCFLIDPQNPKRK